MIPPSTKAFTLLLLSLIFMPKMLLAADNPLVSSPSSSPIVAPSKPTLQPAQLTPSMMESDSTGWIDLLEDSTLSHWHRVPVGKQVKNILQWKLNPSDKTLHCSGTGDHENFQYAQEFGDGVFHCEWRFIPVEGATKYNSGVYIRNSPDGSIWHQAQVGYGNIGYIFGQTPMGGKISKLRVDDHVVQLGKPPGQWNTYELTAKGKKITLWINGAVTATWESCEVPKGELGLEAEGWQIDFRNVKFKPTE